MGGSTRVKGVIALTRRSGASGDDANPNIAAIIAQQLQNIIPQIVRKVTNNINNANANRWNGNGGYGNGGNNNGCTYKEFLACKPKDFDGKGGAIVLIRWIEKMESVMDISGCVNHRKVRYTSSSLINKALTWWNTQIQARGREAAMGMTFHELAKLVPHLVNPESKHIERYIHGLAPQIHGMIRATQPVTIQSAILKAKALTDEAVRCGTLSKSSKKRKEVVELGKQGSSWNDSKRAKVGKGFVAAGPPRNEYTGFHPRDCRPPVRQVAPINAVKMESNQRTCYECGSPDHFRNTCPKLNRAPGQVGNRLTIEGSHNPRNNGNQARGRAFNVNAIDALQDPNIVMGKLFLNDYFATVLFESVANFSFISTKFVPLLIMKPSMVKHGYVIEVADGHRSFDVIIGMDWLSKHKAEIVCHEKVVRMNREVLHVQGERTLEYSKTLMSAKVDEQKLGEHSEVKDVKMRG
ncbi:putative reverse transcriptase domain-containing protein [Tanacetum coccineum]